MITFFTSLKPFRGTTAIQQRNALQSWRHSVPDSAIIVFGASEGGDEALAEVKAIYRPDIACNEFGTPLISAMFAEAQRMGCHSLLGYINGDIILLPDFAAAVARLAKWKTFAAVGQRWDLDWAEPIDFARADWSEKLRAAVAKRGHQSDAAAMDFFAFRGSAVGPLPAFAIGRPAWDNYLVKHLLHRRVPIVDLSKVVVPVHQNHAYSHVAQRRGRLWEGPEADVNRKLARAEYPGFDPQYYTIRNAQWVMLRSAILPALSPQRAWWRFLTTIPDRKRSAMGRFADLYGSTLAFHLLPRRAHHIAVVRLDNIGDFILWLDGARAIRTRYPRPDYHVSLIASSKWSEYAESSGLFDEVIAVDTERFVGESIYRRVTCYLIAKRRFVMAINPTFSRSAWIDDFLVKASGASIRIGQIGDLSNTSIRLKKSPTVGTPNWFQFLSTLCMN